MAGAASLIIAIFIPAQLFVFSAWPPPDTVAGWFTLFRQSPLARLLDMDVLLVVGTVLLITVLLALFVTLRQ